MRIGYRIFAPTVDVDASAGMSSRKLIGPVVGMFAGVLSVVGCHEPAGPMTISNPDPSVKIPAIKEAVVTDDKAAAADMVKNLDSDDPAVRFYAIQGLQRLTGKDFGYRYYDDEDLRNPAVRKWQEWLEAQKN